MKKQISELKELAIKCESFAKKVNLENSAITEFITETTQIAIYSADKHKTICVYFGIGLEKIEVALYSDRIIIPMSMSLAEIKIKIIEWTKFIDNDLNFELEKHKLNQDMIKKEQIEQLEKELAELKNQVQ